MKNQILLHIPHASTVLPKDFWGDVVLSKRDVCAFNEKMGD